MTRPTPQRLEEIRGRLKDPWFRYHQLVHELVAEIDALRAEVEEQCRLNGMGAQRELSLITERDALRADIESIRNDQLYIAAANERDRLRELLGDADGALEDLHFYPCTACEENMEVRDKALAKIREALK